MTGVVADRVVAPDIGTLFTYRGRSYVCEGWIETYETPTVERDWVGHLLAVTQGRKEPMRFASRTSATHVVGRGVAGCTAPLREVYVTGFADWTAERIEEQHSFTRKLEGRETR